MSSKRACRRRRRERAKRRTPREEYRPSLIGIGTALTGVGTGALIVAPLVSVQPYRHDPGSRPLYAPLSAQADADTLHVETFEPTVVFWPVTFGVHNERVGLDAFR